MVLCSFEINTAQNTHTKTKTLNKKSKNLLKSDTFSLHSSSDVNYFMVKNRNTDKYSTHTKN